MVHKAFIKDNIVRDILLFEEGYDESIVASIIESNGYDLAQDCEPSVGKWSTWNGVEFIETPKEILGDLGVITYFPTPEEETPEE
jgi:hypothetical protein